MSRTHVPLKALTGLVRSLNSDVKAFKTALNCNLYAEQTYRTYCPKLRLLLVHSIFDDNCNEVRNVDLKGAQKAIIRARVAICQRKIEHRSTES